MVNLNSRIRTLRRNERYTQAIGLRADVETLPQDTSEEINTKAKVLCNLAAAYTERAESAQGHSGDYTEALMLYDTVLSLQPGNPMAMTSKAKVLEKQGKHEEALGLLNEVLESEPESTAALSIAASVRRKQGMPDEAVDLYERIIEISSDRAANAAASIGQVYEEQGEDTKALRHYLESITKYPKDAVLHNCAARIYQKQNDWEKALEHYENALRIRSDNVIALMGSGRIYMQQGNLPEAGLRFFRARELRPEDQELQALLAEIQKYTGIRSFGEQWKDRKTQLRER